MTEFELHDLEMEYISEPLLHDDNEENEDSEVEVRAHKNESMQERNDNCNIDVSYEDLDLAGVTYYPNLERSSQETAGRPPERDGFDADHPYVIPQATLSEFHKEIPLTSKEAVSGEKSAVWKTPIEEEISSFPENNVWKWVTLLEGRTPIRKKWENDLNTNSKGEIISYKSRFVTKGFSQVEGIDYLDIFSPVSRHSTLRF